MEYQTYTSGWKDVEPLFSAGQTYEGTVALGGNNDLGGRFAFVGDSHGFVDSRYNLTSLAGSTVRFRWRLGTDLSYSVLGWYVDDIRVYLCVAIPSVPTLVLPANTAAITDLTPRFDWSNSTPDLHHYQLQIATNNAFNENLVTYSNILVSIYTLTSDLNPGTQYFWRVRAFNTANKPSAWSAVWSFTTP